MIDATSTQLADVQKTSDTRGVEIDRVGICDLTYPIVVPAASTPPSAVKVYNAGAATGAGPSNVSLALKLSVPANAYGGTYSSTWTFTISSGP